MFLHVRFWTLIYNGIFYRLVCRSIVQSKGNRYDPRHISITVRFVPWFLTEYFVVLFVLFIKWFEVIGECSLCWYRWYCWPSLFTLHFPSNTYDMLIQLDNPSYSFSGQRRINKHQWISFICRYVCLSIMPIIVSTIITRISLWQLQFLIYWWIVEYIYIEGRSCQSFNGQTTNSVFQRSNHKLINKLTLENRWRNLTTEDVILKNCWAPTYKHMSDVKMFIYNRRLSHKRNTWDLEPIPHQTNTPKTNQTYKI